MLSGDIFIQCVKWGLKEVTDILTNLWSLSLVTEYTNLYLETTSGVQNGTHFHSYLFPASLVCSSGNK